MNTINHSPTRKPQSAIRNRQSAIRNRMAALLERVNNRFLAESWRWRMDAYRQEPARFAREVLGSWWWTKQEEIARALLNSRRVAVKSANGVGKTYLAADLVLWFLYTNPHSIVLTTAPTWRQVRHVLWQEIRKRRRMAREKFPGVMLTTRLDAGEGWFAIGLATDEPDRFQGFHAENLLIVFDEASGVPDDIWDAAEGVAVSDNNKILAIGNPLNTTGRFYRCFQSPLWRKITISATAHPNIAGKGQPIPGCITPTALQDRLADWCEPIPPASEPDSLLIAHCSELPDHSRGPANADAAQTREAQDTFTWEGRTYRPNNLFRARVLGEFPSADDETLIPLRWIESALNKAEYSRLTPSASRLRLAADIARFGDDSTVIGWRVGPKLIHIETMQGCDLMAVAKSIAALAFREQPETIAIDCIGIGAGVVDRLREMDIQGIQGINVSHRAYDPERFANRRAELYWGLRERFRQGDIQLPNDQLLVQELAAIKYLITARGQIQIEGKDRMKKRMGHSPDRADMLAMLYDESLSWSDGDPMHPSMEVPSPASLLRSEMHDW
jgi:hypothetical protein